MNLQNLSNLQNVRVEFERTLELLRKYFQLALKGLLAFKAVLTAASVEVGK